MPPEDDLNPEETAANQDPPDRTGGGQPSEDPPADEEFVGTYDPDAPEEVEEGDHPVPAVIDILADETSTDPGIKRRRVVRREGRPLSPDERHAIDDEIVKVNTHLRQTEEEKTATVKKYNGEIAESRQMLDDAIGVLKRDLVEADMTRIEEFNFTLGMIYYRDISTDEIVDEREMTEEEKQTSMNM